MMEVNRDLESVGDNVRLHGEVLELDWKATWKIVNQNSELHNLNEKKLTDRFSKTQLSVNGNGNCIGKGVQVGSKRSSVVHRELDKRESVRKCKFQVSLGFRV